MLLPELAKSHEVTAVVSQGEVEFDRVPVMQYPDFLASMDRFDAVICQLGNNPHHEFAFRHALQFPSTIVLHDLVLHHLIVEITLARGDAAGYEAHLRRNHGEAGAAYARGRIGGVHREIGNFLFPSSVEVASRSRSVIVHNDYARTRLQSFGVVRPIVLAPHPSSAAPGFDRPATRRSLGFSEAEQVVGIFGFVTSSKRPAVLLRAFAEARNVDPSLRLLVVGEPAPDVDLHGLLEAEQIPVDTVISTGYVSDHDFDRYVDAVDSVVNLRYPSAGETSGPLIRIIAAGKRVAVSAYAQFSEYPRAVATPIALGEREVPELVAFMLDSSETEPAVTTRRSWMAERSGIEMTAAAYISALQAGVREEERPAVAHALLPLLPQLALLTSTSRRMAGRIELTFSLRNEGQTALLAREYGRPEYRLLLKVYAHGEELGSKWLHLRGDLAPAETAEWTSDVVASADRFALFHAAEGIPVYEFPFVEAELRG